MPHFQHTNAQRQRERAEPAKGGADGGDSEAPSCLEGPVVAVPPERGTQRGLQRRQGAGDERHGPQTTERRGESDREDSAPGDDQ
ncbi:hypothetical protein AAFF_G00356200 [Aldrovandia affinis]|uniref:Uncharacterized protein n=1 Tax=Aldrovandia affinis TaxID=143900 RepID=A0AAD7T9C0_9TELE|nr:hypothetical protein AAFF_G00356200 [Aldrovandia affinis]